jgi:hypothetical protein
MIKYDYNNKACWYVLDMQDDNYIRRVIASFNNHFQMLTSTRPGVSAFTFREPGNRLNKLKKWDKTILIDSSKQLLQLLFKERVNCGSGIVVLPDRNFVVIRSDSHAEIFGLTKEQIGQLLTKANTP